MRKRIRVFDLFRYVYHWARRGYRGMLESFSTKASREREISQVPAL
jgi:hypothetical protein